MIEAWEEPDGENVVARMLLLGMGGSAGVEMPACGWCLLPKAWWIKPQRRTWGGLATSRRRSMGLKKDSQEWDKAVSCSDY